MNLKKLFFIAILVSMFFTVSYAVADWTWMVYMLEDGTGLSGSDDINELEANGSVSGQVNYLVLYNADTDSQDGVYYITKDPNGYDSTIRSSIVYTGFGTDPDMSDWHTLKDYILWCKDNYPANHYGLTLWDHGSGIFKGEVTEGGIFGPVMDDNSTGKDFVDGMKLWQLDDALSAFKSAIGRNIDVVGFDLCLLGHIETSYQLKDLSDYVIASERTEPGDGWDYVAGFSPLTNNPSMSASSIASNIVDTYVASYSSGGSQGSNSVTQACTSTALLKSELIPAVNDFAEKLRHYMYSYESKIKTARNNASDWDTNYDATFYDQQKDFGSFAANIYNDTTLPSDLRTSAQTVINKIGVAVIEEGHTTSEPAYGLKIWMPKDIANDTNETYYMDPTHYLTFSQTKWDEFLYNYANPVPYNVDFPVPQNLTANAGDGTVYLDWDAPASARNTLDHYTIKRNGTTIVSSTTNTSYTDNSVTNGTTYTYSVYAVYTGSPAGTSDAVSVTAVPNAPVTAPYSQDFSSGSLPTGWSNVDNGGSGEVWQFNNPGGRTFSSTSNANGFAILDSDHYGSGHSQNADLISPVFDFSANSSVTLHFEHYFKSYSGSSATLSYSVNGGSSWTTIQSWSSDTSNAATFNQTFNSTIPGSSNVKFKWNYTGTYGYYWCVDDISITASSGSSPSFAVSPSSLSFGNVEVGQSSTKQFAISNSGSATLTGTISTITGYSVAEVTRGHSYGRNSLSYSISAGSSKTYNLTFSPTSATSYNGNISISSNDTNHSSNSLAVTGSGSANADISLNPTSISESVEIEHSVNKTLTVSNNGGATLNYSASVNYSSSRRATLINEDFATFPPTGWSTSGGGNWMSKTTNSAGGTSPEAVFYWSPDVTATQRLISKTIDTSGMPSLTLTFKSFVDHYSGDYTLKVETSSNGSSWNTIATYPAQNAAASTKTITISNSDVGSSSFRIAFTFDGRSYNINNWNVDDVTLTGEASSTQNWLTINSGTSASGNVNSGSSDNLTIGLNAAGLSEGAYHGNIVVTSNDPDEGTLTVPVTMNVATAAAPQIAVNPTSLSYGNVVTGQTGSKQFTISNGGNATLTGSIATPTGYTVSLASRDASFGTQPSDRNSLSFSVSAGTSKTYSLVFAPTSITAYNGNVVISNNAGSNVNIAVTGNGIAQPTPDISINPASLSKNISLGQTGTETMTISNDGNATLTYNASVNYPTRDRSTLINEDFAGTFPPTGWSTSGGSNWMSKTTNSAGGASPEAVFYWEPSATATQRLTSKTVDTSGMTTLTLSFKNFVSHYSGDYTLRVETSSNGTSWNSIATYPPQNASASTKTITINNSDVGSSTFRIAFTFDGNSYNINNWNIDDVVLSGATQNTSNWLTIDGNTATSGSVNGGNNDALSVGFNTSGVSAGTYNANITVTSNDPDEGTLTVPVTMTVTETQSAAINVSPTSLSYGNVTTGQTSTKQFTISNTGGATLTGSIATPTGYTVNLASRGASLGTKPSNRNSLSFSINAGTSKTYNLVFGPTATTAYNGNVVISNNAGSNVNIAVTGTGIAPAAPEIAINPTSITKSAQEGNTASETMTISNSGNANLNYTATVNYSSRDRSALLEEHFTNSFPPTGWTLSGGSNWVSKTTNKAGGSSPEAVFYWSPDITATQRLITKPMDTTGMDNVALSFKHFVDNYGGAYTLKVETSSNGTNWNTVSTYPNADMAAANENININNSDVGSSSFRIAFTFEGRSYNIDSWNIDDVMVIGDKIDADTWLTINNTSSATGTVTAGNNVSLNIGLNSNGLTVGTYNANIIVTSNDSDEPSTSVPVTFNVTSSSAPGISVNPTSLAYGDIVTGQSSSKQFTIQNTGNATLSGTVSTPSGYTASIAARGVKPVPRNSLAFSVNAQSTKTFNLVFAPTSQTTYNGNVVIYNNAGSDVNIAVTGTGVAALEPEIAINPTSLSKQLQPNGTGSETMTISNNGSANLTYTASVSYASKSRSTILSANFESGYFPSGWAHTTNSSVGWFVTSNGSSSYFSIPSHTKYACSNDDAANDDGSEDYLITSSMDLSGYDNVSITFDSFYDAQYSQKAYVEVNKGNGWNVVSELSGNSSWTTLAVDLSAYCGESNVKVAFHADDAGAWASGWAVDNIVVSGEEGTSTDNWLSINSNASGTIVAGGNSQLGIGFNASGLSAGTYTANIVVTSNDPNQSSVNVPVTLTVASVRAPGNVSIIIRGDNILLSWDKVRAADSYKILYSDTPEGPFRVLDSIRDNKYSTRVHSNRGFYKVVSIKN